MASVFEPFGGTSAMDLTRCLPPGGDVAILLLDCRDVRHVLYTSFVQASYCWKEVLRTLDITCCDDDDAIVARNVFFLTFLLSPEQKPASHVLWDLYHHLYIDDEVRSLARHHTQELLEFAESLDAWYQGPFAANVHFGDAATLKSVQAIWVQYATALSGQEAAQSQSIQESLEKAKSILASNDLKGELRYRGARAAAPLGLQALQDPELNSAMEAWLTTGTCGPTSQESQSPNPLFSIPLTGSESGSANVLSPTCNPLFGFHLAVAEAPVADTVLDALQLEDVTQSENKFLSAAQRQFADWVRGFQELSSTGLVVRFVSANSLVLCHTLQHFNETGELCANLYRRKNSLEQLVLHSADYATSRNPTRFSVIESSDLIESFDTLSIITAAAPLLRDEPQATLYTEMKMDIADKQRHDRLLDGPLRTMSTLLGISPVEYWADVTVASDVDEYMLAASAAQHTTRNLGLRHRLAWRPNCYLTGKSMERSKLSVKPADAAALILNVYQESFSQSHSVMDVEVPGQEEKAPIDRLGSFVLFVKRLLRCINTDSSTVCKTVLDKLNEPQLSLALYEQGFDTGALADNSQHALASHIAISAPHFSCELDPSNNITSITGCLIMPSTKSRQLLADKAPVVTRKVSSTTFEVHLGNQEHIFTLDFPVPVNKEGSRTRIARASGYVEIIASLADPCSAETLDGSILPCGMAFPRGRPPVCLNIPYLSLDALPILDVTKKEKLKFLTTLTSWTFSARERKLREQLQAIDSPPSPLPTPPARMNFKESIFTMFMLASGLQGGQTGLFAIHHPERGGIHMLIFVSAIRLDSPHATAVLDAAVIPFTVELIKSGQLDSFLLILRTLECCTLTVDDDELLVWKKALPALVERCRNWQHHETECEYRVAGASIPLHTEPGQQVICSCGAAKLPKNFINLPEWETAAQFATRVAISPIFASPLVEKIVEPEILRQAAAAVPGIGLSQRQGGVEDDQESNPVEIPKARCWSCGATEGKNGGALRRCMRCLKVWYCSVECQKRDWKKHRMECEEAKGSWESAHVGA